MFFIITEVSCDFLKPGFDQFSTESIKQSKQENSQNSFKIMKDKI